MQHCEPCQSIRAMEKTVYLKKITYESRLALLGHHQSDDLIYSKQKIRILSMRVVSIFVRVFLLA